MLAFACAVALWALAPAGAFAVDSADPVGGLTLAVKDRHDGEFIVGTRVDIYRVATVQENGTLKPTAAFKKYAVSWDVEGSSDVRNLADTLEAYIVRDKIAPTASGKTDANGISAFPQGAGSLKPGYYLVIADRHTFGAQVHEPTPSLVAVPYVYESSEVEYAPVVSLKYAAYDEPFDLDVTVVWKGDDPDRPSEVRVYLMRDGEIYDIAILDESSGWHIAWPDLDPQYRWTVVEDPVPNGYEVSIRKDGTSIVVVNTIEDEEPVGSGEISVTPGASSGNPDEELPQTGQLWWPVPAMAALGAAFLLVGFAKRRES